MQLRHHVHVLAVDLARESAGTAVRPRHAVRHERICHLHAEVREVVGGRGRQEQRHAAGERFGIRLRGRDHHRRAGRLVVHLQRLLRLRKKRALMLMYL